MRSLSKIIYFTSICYIIVCCIIAVLFKSLPIEFKNYNFNEQSSGLFFLGIPIAILFTIARLGFKNIDKSKIRIEILKTFLISGGIFALFFLYALATFGSSMCTTSTGEVLFIKKNSNSSKIVERHFGCGATDSSPATVTIAKQTVIISLFWYYTPIDTTTLNTAEWIRVKE